jgi:hypothetical protein
VLSVVFCVEALEHRRLLSTSLGTVFDGASGDNSATIIITNSAPADVLTVNPIQPSLSATEGQVFSGRVANFINTNAANANLADFTTTIDWGDGTTTSGTLSNPAGNIYAVDGTHTYGDEGTYTTSVTVSSTPPRHGDGHSAQPDLRRRSRCPDRQPDPAVAERDGGSVVQRARRQLR